MGVNEIENLIKNRMQNLSEGTKRTCKQKMMNSKIVSAQKVMQKQVYDNRVLWRETKKKIPFHIKGLYKEIWKKYINEYQKILEKKYTAKKEWLCSKWKKAKCVPDVLRGITLSDQVLPDEFSSAPKLYGGVQLENSEMKSLKL